MIEWYIDLLSSSCIFAYICGFLFVYTLVSLQLGTIVRLKFHL